MILMMFQWVDLYIHCDLIDPFKYLTITSFFYWFCFCYYVLSVSKCQIIYTNCQFWCDLQEQVWEKWLGVYVESWGYIVIEQIDAFPLHLWFVPTHNIQCFMQRQDLE
jgi:hypothetical protein